MPRSLIKTFLVSSILLGVQTPLFAMTKSVSSDVEQLVCCFNTLSESLAPFHQDVDVYTGMHSLKDLIAWFEEGQGEVSYEADILQVGSCFSVLVSQQRFDKNVQKSISEVLQLLKSVPLSMFGAKNVPLASVPDQKSLAPIGKIPYDSSLEKIFEKDDSSEAKDDLSEGWNPFISKYCGVIACIKDLRKMKNPSSLTVQTQGLLERQSSICMIPGAAEVGWSPLTSPSYVGPKVLEELRKSAATSSLASRVISPVQEKKSDESPVLELSTKIACAVRKSTERSRDRAARDK